MGEVLDTSSTIMCMHGGQAQATAPPAEGRRAVGERASGR